MSRTTRRIDAPEEVRVQLSDDARGSTLIPLPSRRWWKAGLVVGTIFVVMSSIAWGQIASIRKGSVETVTDLTGVLFQLFWTIGWSGGVIVLGALTFLLFFYTESARVQGERLVFVPSLGPVRFRIEYDLEKIRNLRIEEAGGAPRNHAQVVFEYGESRVVLGNVMPRRDAERSVEVIRTAMLQSQGPSHRNPTRGIDLLKLASRFRPREKHPQRSVSSIVASGGASSGSRSSSLALLAANVAPLAGVLLFQWDLGHVMVLYWVESGIIAIYTVLKLAVVERWVALIAGPFFLCHFGAFMSVHFLFIYGMFVRGLHPPGPEEPVWEALGRLFGPLWVAILILVISHGVSFLRNFLASGEFETKDARELMTDPYRRVVLMHLTIIFGGWLVLLFDSPLPGLVMLVVLKTVVDLRAHRKEHEPPRTDAPPGE